jgi:hypothetical protein
MTTHERHAKEWTVQLLLSEEGDRTRAEARWRTGDQTHLRGVGEARRNPSDPMVPEMGDELAASRAIADLAHQLLEAAVRDIEVATHPPATLRA